MDLGIRKGVFEKGQTLRASGLSLFQFLIGERDAGWMRPAERVHEQLQALGLDSRLEVIPDAGHAIKEIIGRDFMKRMDRMRPTGSS